MLSTVLEPFFNTHNSKPGWSQCPVSLNITSVFWIPFQVLHCVVLPFLLHFHILFLGPQTITTCLECSKVFLINSFYMTFTMPVFCLIFLSQQAWSRPCLFFSLYNLVLLYVSSLVFLDMICDSHLCPSLATSLEFCSLTQVYPVLKKKCFFTLFQGNLKYFLIYLTGFWPKSLSGQFSQFIGIINHIGCLHKDCANDTRLPKGGMR